MDGDRDGEDELNEVVGAREDRDVAVFGKDSSVAGIEPLSLAPEAIEVRPVKLHQLRSLARRKKRSDALLEPLLIVPHRAQRTRRQRLSEDNVPHLADLDRVSIVVDDLEVHSWERETSRSRSGLDRRKGRVEHDSRDGGSGLGRPVAAKLVSRCSDEKGGEDLLVDDQRSLGAHLIEQQLVPLDDPGLTALSRKEQAAEALDVVLPHEHRIGIVPPNGTKSGRSGVETGDGVGLDDCVKFDQCEGGGGRREERTLPEDAGVRKDGLALEDN